MKEDIAELQRGIVTYRRALQNSTPSPENILALTVGRLHLSYTGKAGWR